MRCAAILAALIAFPVAAAAQDITLTSRDGTLALSGSLQGFDGELYRIMTRYGLLTVDAQGVICDGPGCPDLTSYVAELRVTGSPDKGARLLPGLLAAFAQARGLALRTEVTGSGAVHTIYDPDEEIVLARFSFTPAAPGPAVEALRSAAADFDLADLPEPGLIATTLGVQALVAVVSPKNPIAQLATADLARVLSGKVTNWSELGGPDMPVVVHALAPQSGFRAALETRLGQPLIVGETHEDAAALAAAVTRDPWGIAVTTSADAGMARVMPLTDSCGFLLEPSALSVKAEDYPLAQPFYLLTAKRHLPLLGREFLEFVNSPSANAALAEGGLLGRGMEQTDLVSDGHRLVNVIRAAGDAGLAEAQRLTSSMHGAERISATFRFEDGTSRLDASSRDHLVDLVRLIETGHFSDRELVFVGFSDGSGDPAANLELSRERAEVVFNAVADAVPDLGDLRVKTSIDAFGEALPMACDETAIGRQINRRVEVWLRAPRESPVPEN
ncbi:phosphate ABC transporter substrate-binding/OmpA family protein [Tabrizicola sp. J26]|uniref:phosphate ABC transporter substrate-binding/OmpA family protein n=1 Tax=Alitabrizicola rongguiensis TaxID=2909234 RepID=UPI001F36FF9F|nr:phosphate ABC transporter substrate-binding/OmpA family protein [Tabrizicola rongguiensis]MCF1708135.1 phosphate ABC transporter substrate-binding/OmpA family protein [Tabrizicola rongguiensis]